MEKTRGEYRKSAERRAQILDAAFTVFARSGYTASSVSEIAREVGITQTGVLHHFAGGKMELLVKVLEQRDARAAASLRELHGREFLLGLVEISRAQAALRGAVQLQRILSTEALDPGHPAYGYFHDRIAHIVDAITVAFSEIEAEGGLRPGVGPRAAAIRVMAMTEGLEQLWLSGFEIDMAEDIHSFISEFLLAPLPQVQP